MNSIRNLCVGLVFLTVIQSHAAQYDCLAVRLDNLVKTGEDSYTRDYTFNSAAESINCLKLENTKAVVCWDAKQNQLQLVAVNSEKKWAGVSTLRMKKDSQFPDEFNMKLETDIENYSPKITLELTCQLEK